MDFMVQTSKPMALECHRLLTHKPLRKVCMSFGYYLNCEQWKAVVGYEGRYEVSDFGRVRSLAHTGNAKHGSFRTVAGKVLSLLNRKGGYTGVTLHKDNVQKSRPVHILVADSFIGGRVEGSIVLHWNDIPSDNRVENLRYGTQKDNCYDKERNGNKIMGERHVLAKLNANDVIEIRRIYADGEETQKALAEKFGVCSTKIFQIIHRQSWAHI